MMVNPMSLHAQGSMLQGVNNEPFIELSYPVSGRALPADHGYGLYAAIVHLQPAVRQESELSILTVPGIPDREGKILLTEQSHLRIRVPVSKSRLVYALAGKKIRIGKHEIFIGIPELSLLQPAPALRARIVTLKGHTEPENFLAAAKNRLEALGIQGNLSIPADRYGAHSRKTIKVQRYKVVGFTTEVAGLNDEDSVKLQMWGLGGKRHMGCGVFVS
jgi:CRISPR-associated protein Cas6